MRLRHVYTAIALTTSLTLAAVFAGGAAQSKSFQESKPKATVLFVVTSGLLPTSYVVPFVIIEQGKFKEPVAGDSEAAEINRFARAYYSRGSKYHVLFGGSESGSLTIRKSNKDSECGKTSADVTLQSQTRLNRNVMALATNDASLGGAKSVRRSPTAAERAALMPLVQAAYKQKGVPAALVANVTTVNLTALDLDNDGKAELVGSFVVKKQRGGAERFALFMIAEPEGASYRTSVLQYERFAGEDIMSGANISVIENNGVYLERLVDGLDLDGDGAFEVITEIDGLEGDSYHIYKKQGGAWKQVYEFSNYRCAF